MPPDLTRPSKLYRSTPARGLAAGDNRVDREGGVFGAGLIEGVSIIERGEAKGHSQWVDQTMLEQVHAAINAASKGIKVRYQHPSASGDGLGKYIGRVTDAHLSDGKVTADLHVAEAAHRSPDGNLGDYILGLAKEDPDSFGMSISFEPDPGAEKKFAEMHRDEDGAFQSPDDKNENNYPHVRLHRLRASDLVDEGAATNGLFQRTPVAAEAEALASYALGLNDQKPSELTCFDVDPDRVQGFIARYLSNNNLKIVTKDDSMPDETTTDLAAEQDENQVETPTEEQTEGSPDETELSQPDTQPETPEEQGAGDEAAGDTGEGDVADTDLSEGEQPDDKQEADEAPGKAYMDMFGEQQGAIYFARGLSVEQAQAEFLESLKKENEELKSRLSASDRGVDAPVDFNAEPPAEGAKSLASLVKIRGAKD